MAPIHVWRPYDVQKYINTSVRWHEWKGDEWVVLLAQHKQSHLTLSNSYMRKDEGRRTILNTSEVQILLPSFPSYNGRMGSGMIICVAQVAQPTCSLSTHAIR